MAVFKCKMCGGTLEINNNESVAICEYCDTKQTLPKSNDEVVNNLYNRANNLRLKCEFDKAEQVYEKILEIDDTESEAHWGIVLCKYGIEYVEDPKSYTRVPTCHRTSYDVILAEPSYLSAIANADVHQKAVYEEEAREINDIQGSILDVVKNEKPFDVFICYKEIDENGQRTIDSVLANDIYHQLTNEGFKVFYSAITLEDKLGQEYEPYIFAALNSAKVMLVIGTKPEYFEAVWVKNEWSRFMKLIKTDRSKILIPCYRDMDAYDLPEEFSHLQSQDMSKIGFINDIERGIKKILIKEQVKAEPVVVTTTVQPTMPTATNTASLLKRAYLFLEDGDFESADEYCEKVLDIEPENVQAYLGKLLIECGTRKIEDLSNYNESFKDSVNYQKIIRFGDDDLKKTLCKCLEEINERIEVANRAAREKEELENKEMLALKLKRKKQNKKIAIIVPSIIASVTIISMLFAFIIIPKVKLNNSVAISVGDSHVVGLKSDGTVVAVGFNGRGQCNVEEWRDIVAISASMNHTVGLKSDGTVVATEFLGDRRDYDGYCEVDYLGGLDMVAISTNFRNTVFLTSEGTIRAIGDNTFGQCETWELNGDENIVAISAGGGHTVGLKSNGTVVATEFKESEFTEYYGECDVTEWTDIVAVSAGMNHTIGLKSDGTVVAVGNNDYGQCNVSDWTDIIAISTGSEYTVGLKSDGTVVAVGNNEDGQCNVSGWKDIVSISAGGRTVGIKSNGKVVSTDNVYLTF